MQVLSRAVYIFICTLPPILFCFTAGKLMLPLAIAIALHESAHLITLKVWGGKMLKLAPAPFGLCMEFDESTLSLIGEAVVSAAGSIMNLICAAFSIVIYKVFHIDLLNFFTVSFMLALVNLIPAEPLDGGRLLRILLTFFRGPEAAFRVTAIVTYLFGFLVFLFSSYMLLTAQSGIYPLLFSVYLFAGNAKTLEKATFGEKESI